jgi:4'-phosphopantetheinyl transferase EntD
MPAPLPSTVVDGRHEPLPPFRDGTSPLDALFEPPVATAMVPLDAPELEEPVPEEHDHLAKARRPRVLEFRAGRCAARRALEALGVSPSFIGRHPDRSPIWPPGIVGSITHVGRDGVGWAAAAVARDEDFSSIGVDAESATPLEPALWRRILTAGELERLDLAPTERRGLIAKTLFSAKEALYKCQYPLTRAFLEFREVEVDLEEEHFTARVSHELARRALPAELRGRHLVWDALVLTAITLPSKRAGAFASPSAYG